MRERLEYAPVWLLTRLLAVLPRRLAHFTGILLGRIVFHLHPRLRRVGMRNLELAYPQMLAEERRRILKGVYNSLGRLLAEFSKLPHYTQSNVSEIAVYQGFENFETAHERGKGVLLLTGHLGGWELGSFVHSLHRHPMNIIVRRLDNKLLDAMVEKYRTIYGNRTMHKDDFARGLLGAMKRGETVGILMDTNMTPPQGVFVDFFGHQACTASGLARVALHTDAAVVPAFTVWDNDIGKYKVTFAPAVKLIRTGDAESDIVANTALFTKAIEEFVRHYPDQWLWVHRRWKTRPAGEPPLY